MGGMEAHNRHLAHALIARGRAVTVFASGDGDPVQPLWPILPRHSEAAFPAYDHAGNAALHAHLDAGFGRAATALRDGVFDLIDRREGYSTVTDFARLRGWSTSVPLASAA